jgi:methylated-DNA-[protein]-cysteine S-methyltransferase
MKLKISPFAQNVYRLTKQIPKGKISTYKQIAHALNTKAYQAVGNALRHNPFAPRVPCHRVVKCNGNIGGFDGATKGKKIQNKIKLLKSEGVIIKNSQVQNFKKILFTNFSNS